MARYVKQKCSKSRINLTKVIITLPMLTCIADGKLGKINCLWMQHFLSLKIEEHCGEKSHYYQTNSMCTGKHKNM